MRISYNALTMGRDLAINQLLIDAKLDYGAWIYSMATFNAREILLTTIGLKLGLSNKIIITMILAFIL
jgi:hypothetical protein